MALRTENTESARQADAQAIGVERGWNGLPVLRNKLVSGDLVKVSMVSIPYTQNGTTANTMSYGNQDGSGFEVSMDSTTTIGQSGGTTYINCTLYGSTIGIRFAKTTNTPSFCVIIDGTPYEVSKYKRTTYFGNQQDSSLNDWETLIIIADNLDDTIPHSVSIFIPVDPSGSKNIRFYGFILERKAGYRDISPKALPYGNGLLTTSNVAVPRTFGSGQPNVKSLKYITYSNTSANLETVTLRAIDDNYNQRVLKIPAGETMTATFEEGGISPISTLQHKASTASVVRYVCWGTN